MNCIPGRENARSERRRLNRLAALPCLSWLAVVLCACSAPASETEESAAPDLTYRVDYEVTPDPAAGGAHVTLTVNQPRHLLRAFDMQRGSIDPDSVQGDGEINFVDDRILWSPPTRGGELRWFAPIDHERSSGEFDAKITPDWAIFRASDLMPAVKTRTLRGATSDTHLAFNLPRGWSSLTPYSGRDNRARVLNPERRFDRPTGWMLLGRFGRRNETIADRRVIVAGPAGHSVRRMDMLALLRWTLPELTNLLPEFPERLTIISAGDPMWRGGLSAPTSLFIHSGRPLLSENGTSTLLHEIMHIGIGLRAEDGADWIIEGLAEFYGLELLRRTGTISHKRHAAALEQLRNWGQEAATLCTQRSSGAVTAQAVTVLDQLDRELRQTSDASLDDVLRQLVTKDRDIRFADLQSVATELADGLPAAIANGKLRGCGS